MISVEKDLLLDLVDSKLHLLREEMAKILEKWGYKNVDKFISDARSGVLEEAEDDAVCIRSIVYDQEKILLLREEWTR